MFIKHICIVNVAMLIPLKYFHLGLTQSQVYLKVFCFYFTIFNISSFQMRLYKKHKCK